jgi:hypothetical protein
MDNLDCPFPPEIGKEVFQVDIQGFCEGQECIDCGGHPVPFNLGDEAFANPGPVRHFLQGKGTPFSNRTNLFSKAVVHNHLFNFNVAY